MSALCECPPEEKDLYALTDGKVVPAQTAPAGDPLPSGTQVTCGRCESEYEGTVYPANATQPVLDVYENEKEDNSPPGSARELLSAVVADRAGGEVRPQQELMVDVVEDAIRNRKNALIQAGTGTGKSLGYLIPAIMSGKRVVVSTATKQLSEQLFNEDLPVLDAISPKVNGPAFTYALIKGRSNYLCLAELDSIKKLEEQEKQASAAPSEDGLFETESLVSSIEAAPAAEQPTKKPTKKDIRELNRLLKWADKTVTGDRTEAPAASDKVWDMVSVDASGCPGATSCPFGEQCFTEIARSEAKQADVVLTNHAQVAQDMKNNSAVLGKYDVLVTDEVHELVPYLSSAWGAEVAPSTMRTSLTKTIRKIPRTGKAADGLVVNFDEAIKMVTEVEDRLAPLEPGLAPELPESLTKSMVAAARILTRIAADAGSAATSSNNEANASKFKAVAGRCQEHAEALVEVLKKSQDGSRVRWITEGYGQQTKVIKTAPLRVGPALMGRLEDTILIGTSATITVGGKFDSFVDNLALKEPVAPPEDAFGLVDPKAPKRPPRDYVTVDVGTPFDYDKQSFIYVPDNTFPAPTGQARFDHTEAVKKELEVLIKAAGGRTLALFTSRKDAENAAEHLRGKIDTPVLCQGDAPPQQLISEFAENEETTLCATMGFWHGVNVPGRSLSLVVMSKLPFSRMDDPLLNARRKAVDDAGGRGFDEVYVAAASVALAQGVGRLIRTSTDKGVVAVLDTRLMSKYYGRTMLSSMPKMRVIRDRDSVAAALRRVVSQQ